MMILSGNRRVVIAILVFFASTSIAKSSQHYTEKQLDVFAARVGRTFWVIAVDNRIPSFLSAPARNAPSFHPRANESFEITELVGRQAKNPYYKVKFSSGESGYILPESFQEELNLTILSVDPKADEKRKAAAGAEEDKKRVEWIQSRPWSQPIKEAAIQRRPVPGMNTEEVKKVLGEPLRVITVTGVPKTANRKVHAPQRFAEEHWFYRDGSVLIFQNKQLARIESQKKENPQAQ